MISFKGNFQANLRKKRKAPERKQLDWSDYQQDIFNNTRRGRGHTIVLATPGSGKSTTILEALYHLPQKYQTDQRTLFVAFNASIAEYLHNRVPEGVRAVTFHKLGFDTVRAHWKEIGPRAVDKDDDIAYELAAEEVGLSPESERLRENLVQAMSLAKATLSNDVVSVSEMLDEHGIELCGLGSETFSDHVLNMMETTLEPQKLNGNWVISFADMLWLPRMHGWTPQQFDRVFVDEAQDLSEARTELALKAMRKGARLTAVGDKYQCVSADTTISTPDGEVRADKLRPGDKVLSWRNNQIATQTVKHAFESDWDHGVRVTTESGKSLLMSPNHKIWYRGSELTEDQHLVYLMYRRDLGFRVGITNKFQDKESPFGQRARSELADKLWVLDICNNREDALYQEYCYSLSYGIPTLVFQGEHRGLNQSRINDVFDTFGGNGAHLLVAKNYHFDYPHWVASTRTTARLPRLAIRMVAHGSKGNVVISEWSNDSLPIANTLEECGIVVTEGKSGGANRKRIRKYCPNYRDALAFMEKVQSLVPNSLVSERLHTSNGWGYLVTASGILPGMEVPVRDRDTVRFERVIKAEEEKGVFVDLDIDDASNFLGNDILTHNSIYQFAGATPASIDKLQYRLNAKQLPLSVSYRCPKQVVQLAQLINPMIESAPTAIEGSIEATNAERLYDEIKPGQVLLSRTNYPLVTAVFGLTARGIKANIKGRDIAQRLLWRIRCWEPDNVKALRKSVISWRNDICERLKARRRPCIRIQDEAETILRFAKGASNVAEVKARISRFFTDDINDTKQVLLSTVHKAKGLEWDDVFLLEHTFKPDQGEEESNIFYVALTRAKRRLVIAGGRLLS
jgi:hypothetical protein